MPSQQQNLQSMITNEINQINNEVKRIAEKSMWETLKEIEPIAQRKIREIVAEKLGNIPPSEYYDRTGADGIESAYEVKITQGGGNYVLSLWINPDNVKSNGVEGVRPKAHKLYAYSYSWGKNRGLIGQPLEGPMKQYVVEGVLWEIDQNNFESVQDAFEEWINTEYPTLFENKFRIYMDRFI